MEMKENEARSRGSGQGENNNKLEEKTKLDHLSERIDIEKTDPTLRARATMRRGESAKVPRIWMEEGLPEAQTREPKFRPMLKRFFIWSLAFFAIAAVLAVFRFFAGTGTFSNDSINLTLSSPSFAAGGEEFPVLLEVENKNPVALASAMLTLEYPKSSDDLGEMSREEFDLGEIAPGGRLTKEIKVTVFGEQGSTREIVGRLEYRTRGSNAIFVKETKTAVAISQVPVSLSISAPEKSASNQEITLKVKAVLNAQTAPENLALFMRYPSGFEFSDSSPEPTSGNTIFDLSGIEEGNETIISITGRLLGEAGEERTFHASVGEKSKTNTLELESAFNSTFATVSIDGSVVALLLTLNGEESDKYVGTPGEQVIGVVNWANNTEVNLTDLEISVRLSGNVFADQFVTTSNGFYDSGKDTIIWDKNTIPSLEKVAPGKDGQVSFSIRAAESITQGSVPDPSINVNVSVKARNPSEGNVLVSVTNQESARIIYSSRLQFAAQARYRGGPLTNSGPLPPKAEEPTTYTITWTITNTSNPIGGAAMTTRLPIYVSYIGNSYPSGETISYNPTTREVTWAAGDIEPRAGFGAASREASFQVELTPSLSQVGQSPNLTEVSKLSGTDRFTMEKLQSSWSALTTRLTNDPGFEEDEGKVVN